MNAYTLPPGDKWQAFELRALGIRDFAGIGDDSQLNPFALAGFANLLVVEFDQIQGLSVEARQHLLGTASNQWSGGACSQPLPDGRKLIILNPNHGPQRRNATLMEEICHVFLGHQPTRLTIVAQNKRGRAVARDYHHADEEAAYAVGAAALVPYASLRRFVLSGRSASQIARHFGVSRPLVEYRMKVTRLWHLYAQKH